MAVPFKKYGYTINPITDDIQTPQIFLVNKQLKKIGELYPVENLSVTINEVNQPDEVSFTYYKETDSAGSPCFDQLADLSLIQIGDFGFFECSVSKNQNTSVAKSVTAQSLGYSELSQILHTLDVNTDDDMARTDYDEHYPTVFYREIPSHADAETAKKLRESSLLHRILTEAPHYQIGYVSPTLWYVQRTFSWSDKDIVSILREVAEEVSCIFDIQVRMDEDGMAERIISAYDMQYCSHCWEEVKESGGTATSSTSKFRDIVNGVCQSCGESKYVKEIGVDSGIYISTDNLSDDISMNGDPDSIKNCLKITGGDDSMTATVQGLSMSASGKIMAFSDWQKKAMSPELREKLDNYNRDYSDNAADYEALLETEYNMQDIRLYLQSGKMPPIEKEIQATDEALYSVMSSIRKYFKSKFFIRSYENYYKYPTSSARTSIENTFTTFMPEGFSMTIDKSNTEEDVPGKVYDSSAVYPWYGTIKVYSTGNRDDSYTLHVTKNSGTYVTGSTSDEHSISSDASIQSMVDSFQIQFYFADQSQEEYKGYLEQYTAYLLSTVDLSYENERKKEWDKYGYHLLQSYADGYQKCIETIDDMLSTADGETRQILTEMRDKYSSIQNDILQQMNVLEDQLFAVCRYLGGSYDDSYLNDKGEVSYNFKYYKDGKKATIQKIFEHMINPDYAGGYNDGQTVFTPNEYIGDKPFQCLKCNSSNVVVSTEGNVCRNDGCGAKGSDIYTYCDMMKNISDSYRLHADSGKTIAELRTDYRNRFDIKSYLGETLYIELRSFIREDVYNNSNFTSDGLSNSQLIEQAKELKAKAEQELAKACEPQYSVTTSLSSVVAQKEFIYQGVKVNDDYSKFRINNYVRVKIDNDLRRMRITSLTLPFPMTDKIDVTFSNVTNCKTDTAMNIKEILDSAASMATSYDYVATQADKGAVANDQFVQIKKEGLNASLMNVINSRDQEVVIDSHGILLRKKIHETDGYSDCQMKLINRNLVMTDDNWKTAKLAVGLGMYEGVKQYGIWTDLLCGNLIMGNKLKIYGGGDGTSENATVIIDGNGITLDGGNITWTTPLKPENIDGLEKALTDMSSFQAKVANTLGVTAITSNSVISPKIAAQYVYVAKNNYSVEMDPNHSAGSNTLNGYLFAVRDKTLSDEKQVIMGVTTNGDGYFNGEIQAKGSFMTTNSDESVSTKISGGVIQITSQNIGTQGIMIQDGSGDNAVIRGNYLDFSYKNTGRRTAVGFINAESNETGFYLINSNNTIKGHLKMENNSDASSLYCTNVTIDGGITLDNNKYIYGNVVASEDNTRLSTIGRSYGSNSSSSWSNIWIGHYNAAYSGNTNSIFLSTAAVTSYGTVYTPDGTVSKSDARQKTNICSLDINAEHFILSLNPVKYKLKNGTSGRYHYGFIAQEVEKNMNKTIGDAGIITKSPISIETDENFKFVDLNDDSTFTYGLRYEEFIAPIVLLLQKQHKKITELENRIAEYNCSGK